MHKKKLAFLDWQLHLPLAVTLAGNKPATSLEVEQRMGPQEEVTTTAEPSSRCVIMWL